VLIEFLEAYAAIEVFGVASVECNRLEQLHVSLYHLLVIGLFYVVIFKALSIVNVASCVSTQDENIAECDD
jgi:hypothetical protein